MGKRYWRALRRFGYERGVARPKTPEDWNRIYLNHRVYLYGIKCLDLQFAKTGSGKSGARHFHYWKVPPIRWWNPDLRVHEQKVLSGNSKLMIEKENGEMIELVVDNMTDDEIMQKVLACSERPPVAEVKEQSVQ